MEKINPILQQSINTGSEATDLIDWMISSFSSSVKFKFLFDRTRGWSVKLQSQDGTISGYSFFVVSGKTISGVIECRMDLYIFIDARSMNLFQLLWNALRWRLH